MAGVTVFLFYLATVTISSLKNGVAFHLKNLNLNFRPRMGTPYAQLTGKS